MTARLTKKQEALFEFVATFIERHGYPPTLLDIRRHTGAKSPTAGLDVLKALAKKGLLRRQRYIARGLTITDEGHALLRGLQERRLLGC